jgi:hypothetical protein
MLPNKRQRSRPPNKAHYFTISKVSSASQGFCENEMLGNIPKVFTIYRNFKMVVEWILNVFLLNFWSSGTGLDR